ncbi:hypothetical protein [Micromonospora sp. NPDC005413]|uniref:hypothetical protein n=1 Tax=Micromonospora sp. NPDC005413 TaxID=3154563 RepID=UPI0033BE1E98
MTGTGGSAFGGNRQCVISGRPAGSNGAGSSKRRFVYSGPYSSQVSVARSDQPPAASGFTSTNAPDAPDAISTADPFGHFVAEHGQPSVSVDAARRMIPEERDDHAVIHRR